MIDAEKYILQGKPHHPTKNNCYHFFDMVWSDIFGVSFIELLPTRSAAYKKTLSDCIDTRMRRLDAPENPCAAYYPSSRGFTHIGLYVDGMILHQDEFGARLESLERMRERFGPVEYYR